MTAPALTYCVFCASRGGTEAAFTAAARATGQEIARLGGRLVYGGGKSGLMGEVASATLQAGASVIGVIPQALVDREHANRECTELYVVADMHERKQMMASYADAFVVLPGGIGTFEEFFEAWTWRQLGYHNKPIGLLNVGGYYDTLLQFLEHAVRVGMMTPDQMRLICWHDSVPALLQALAAESARLQAALA